MAASTARGCSSAVHIYSCKLLCNTCLDTDMTRCEHAYIYSRHRRMQTCKHLKTSGRNDFTTWEQCSHYKVDNVLNTVKTAGKVCDHVGQRCMLILLVCRLMHVVSPSACTIALCMLQKSAANQTLAVSEVEDTRNLWDTEVKSRSKLTSAVSVPYVPQYGDVVCMGVAQDGDVVCTGVAQDGDVVCTGVAQDGDVVCTGVAQDGDVVCTGVAQDGDVVCTGVAQDGDVVCTGVAQDGDVVCTGVAQDGDVVCTGVAQDGDVV